MWLSDFSTFILNKQLKFKLFVLKFCVPFTFPKYWHQLMRFIIISITAINLMRQTEVKC